MNSFQQGFYLGVIVKGVMVWSYGKNIRLSALFISLLYTDSIILYTHILLNILLSHILLYY